MRDFARMWWSNVMSDVRWIIAVSKRGDTWGILAIIAFILFAMNAHAIDGFSNPCGYVVIIDC